MSMWQAKAFVSNLKTNPFWDYVCDNCNRKLSEHYTVRPENWQQVREHRVVGKLYCTSDQLSWAGSYHQTKLTHDVFSNKETK